MKIIKIYDKTKTYILPNNKLATPAYMAESNPATQIATFLIATDEKEEGLLGLYLLSQMISMYNFKQGLSNDEYCQLLEAEFNKTAPELMPTAEERIAASMEFQVLTNLPNKPQATLRALSVANTPSNQFKQIKRNYDKGLWGTQQLNIALNKGVITSTEIANILE